MKLLNKKSIGLDIADRTMELAEIESSDSDFKVLNLISANLSEGIVENGQIKDKVKLAEAVKLLFSDAKSKPLSSRKIVFALPESQVFLRNFALGAHDKKNRDELARREALLSVPIREDDLVFSYRVISESPADTKFLLAAASRTITKEWLDFFRSIEIEVEILDIEALAVFRGLFGVPPEKPICVLDIGSRTANICIFDQSGLRYSFPSFIAGNSFTDAVAKAAEAEFAAAEKIKITQGLSSSEQTVASELKSEIDKLISSIEETFDYFKKGTGDSVSEIVLVGGSSQMSGLADYLSTALKIDTRIGTSRLHGGETPLIYIEAIGLAMRGLDSIWDDRDPNLPVHFPDGKEKIKFIASAKESAVINKIQNIKLNKQILLLIGSLLLGLLLLIGALWFRESQRKIRLNNIKIESSGVNVVTGTLPILTATPTSTENTTASVAKPSTTKKKR